MNIAIGSDHRALELKLDIVDSLRKMGHHIHDYGSFTTDPIDYPDIAELVSVAVAKEEYIFGILICGTGIGMSIAANKIKGIRAALCRDSLDVQRARGHNNANIICLGSETTTLDEAVTMIKEFIVIPFEGGRHIKRIDKISRLENR